MPKYAIYPEKQSTPTTTSANSSYPIANLTGNDYRKKVWKAASSVATATLRVPIAANAQAISLHNTNAETAICTITLDSAEQTLDNQAAVSYASGAKTGIPLTGHGYVATILFY